MALDWRKRKRKPRPDLAKRNKDNAIHGMTGTPTYKTWDAMKRRVRCRTDKDYGNYGGRGIDMDPRWNSFISFYKDMGNKPNGTTIGRIDNCKGYWPNNCRWETILQQNNNRRSSVYITVNGETLSMAQWAKKVGISRHGIRYRFLAGWEPCDIISKTYGKASGKKEKLLCR